MYYQQATEILVRQCNDPRICVDQIICIDHFVCGSGAMQALLMDHLVRWYLRNARIRLERIDAAVHTRDSEEWRALFRMNHFDPESVRN